MQHQTGSSRELCGYWRKVFTLVRVCLRFMPNAALLKYGAQNTPNTPPSHIILTLKWPALTFSTSKIHLNVWRIIKFWWSLKWYYSIAYLEHHSFIIDLLWRPSPCKLLVFWNSIFSKWNMGNHPSYITTSS